MSPEIRINRAHYPVTVLGPGKRICIWLQGCSIACSGCISKDTWSAEAGTEMRVEELVNWCRQFESAGVDGITISGGEPFEQPDSLEALLRELHEWTDQLILPVDYLCYSGKTFKEIRKQYPQILLLLDTIIPDPFKEALPGKPLRGSANQPMIYLTDLGSSRFVKYADESLTQSEKRLQLAVNNRSAWFIGIPERGDMEKLTQLCKAQGLNLEDTSW